MREIVPGAGQMGVVLYFRIGVTSKLNGCGGRRRSQSIRTLKSAGNTKYRLLEYGEWFRHWRRVGRIFNTSGKTIIRL